MIITQGVSRIVEPLIQSNHEIVGVLESASRNYKKREALYKMIYVAWSLYSKVAGNHNSLKSVAKRKGLPYRFMMSSDDPGLEDWVQSLQPDVIVVFSMSQLLKEKIFSIPKYGTINLHPAMLPEYRGPQPDFWQYYNMEINPGITVHYIDKGEDTGDIIYQTRTEIPLVTKSPARLNKLVGQTGVSLILKALDAILAGNAPRIKQPEISPTPRAKNLLPEKHKEIIDWKDWPIERVWHVLRGTELWLNALPQPTGLHKGQRWIVDEFDKCSSSSAEPGTIGKTNGRHYVATSEGRIYLSRKFNVKNLIISLLRIIMLPKIQTTS